MQAVYKHFKKKNTSFKNQLI